MRKPSARVSFADTETKRAWEKVAIGDKDLFKQLLRAKEDLEQNAFCGIQVPKRLIPKEYRHLSNLWKYNLPNAWRLLYTLTTPDRVEIISVILDWMDHKDYERLFRF